VRTRDGTYRWFSVRGVPILNADGSAREWVGANTDIHDEKVAADDVARLASLVESTDDALFGQDLKGIITSWNRGAEKIFGYRSEEVVGTSIMRLIPTLAQAMEREIQRKIAAGEHVGNFETLRQAKDGRQFPASITISPVKNSAGQVIGASKVLRDITDLKAAEHALRESEWRLSGILRQSPAGIIQIDVAGRMTLVNQRWCEMLGYSEAELLGRNVIEITHESSMAVTKEAVQKLREGGDDVQVEKLYLCKDGSVLTAQSNVTALRSRQGEFLGLIAVVMDISERKKFELELQIAKTEAEKANLAKSDFLSNMSHELRSPLNAILGFAQLIDTSSPPPTNSQRRGVEQILKAGWYLLEMINEILDLAQIEAGKLPINSEPLSLSEIVSECKDMVEPQAQSRDIRVSFNRPQGPTFVFADRTRLTQVIINLLTNAIKYNKLGGTVLVDCQLSTKERIRLSIKDSGDGLEPDEIRQLFQRFNRLGKEGGAEEGTGIGLVMSKKLIELMKGDIGVESTKGVGSVFWVELPLTTAPKSLPARDVAPTIATEAISPSAPMRTVLYVEDNAANLMLVADCIERRHDIHLMSAPDGASGVKIALASQPDVILMDIHLPGINGLEAMHMLAQYPATKHIPVIALSANAMPRDVEKYLAAGFFRYLAKPINIKELMDTLNLALESSKTQSR
jgi:PAS domain S-box-containing protein